MGYDTIYCIKNIKNNKKYIGFSTRVMKRWKKHKNDLNKHKHHNSYLQNSWGKYGQDKFVFSVIEENVLEDALPGREMYWIDYYNIYESRYNLTLGGEGSLGHRWSEEEKERISRRMKNRKFTKERRKHLSEAGRGRVFLEEIKRKMSASTNGMYTGKRNPMYDVYLTGELNGMYGRHHSQESINKIRKSINEICKRDGIEIYKRYYNSSLTQKELGIEYNISESTVGRIVNHEHWTTEKIDDYWELSNNGD